MSRIAAILIASSAALVACSGHVENDTTKPSLAILKKCSDVAGLPFLKDGTINPKYDRAFFACMREHPQGLGRGKTIVTTKYMIKR